MESKPLGHSHIKEQDSNKLAQEALQDHNKPLILVS